MRIDPDPETPVQPHIAELRMRAHFDFDKIWKLGFMSRGEAYYWLAREMSLLPYEAHFRKMNHQQLEQAIVLVQAKLAEYRKEKG